MYLHLGSDVVILKKNIVGIFDLDTATISKHTKSYLALAEKEGRTLVRVHLETGRSHQIRVQFSSRNLPLVNDQRYNSRAKRGQIALWAYDLVFPHPITREPVRVTSFPPESAPWNLFEVKHVCETKP